MPTPILNRPKSEAGNYGSNFVLKKSGRQDRRRSEKYELTTEITNNPNTAKPRIITITGVTLQTPLYPATRVPTFFSSFSITYPDVP
jgi:hypothetical protein